MQGVTFMERARGEVRRVRIVGTGSFLPGAPVGNEELISRFGLETSDAWIRENPGIVSRHFAPPGVASSGLGTEAARAALRMASLEPGDLGAILLGSSTPDWSSPATAARIQHSLGARCPAVDLQSACASFLFALDYGIRIAVTGGGPVLVVGAETKSRFVDPNDHRLLPIFADGAGAMVLSASEAGNPEEEESGFLDLALWTDGSKWDHIYTPAGGSALPATRETVEKGLHTVRMNVPGRVIFEDAVEGMTELSRRICERRGIAPEEVDFLVPHQANLGIIRRVAKNLGFPMERVVTTISETGNIVSASIPFALDRLFRNGGIASGSLVLMVAVGAGYSGGAALYRVGEGDTGGL